MSASGGGMLRRFSVKSVVDALTSTRSAVGAPRRTCFPCEAAQQSARAFCAAATAPTQQADGPASMKKPDWAPGTPASGREQTLGEAFAAMQYHGRGARKVKANVFNRILARISSDEELKYAHIGLELFKKQGIEMTPKTASLFIKACCKAGSPQAAVDALTKAEKYGLDTVGAITPKRFNYLLSQLYRAGDTDTFTRAVAEATARQLSLNPRSHVLIGKFEAEMKARKEEEERKVKEEEEDKIRKEKEEAELKAREEEEEEAKKKLEEEEKEKEKMKAEEEEREKQRQVEEAEEKLKAAEQEAKKKTAEEEKTRIEAETAAATGGGSGVASPDDTEQGVEEEKETGGGPAEGPEDAETKR